jgi:putative oxidoreductase
MRHIPTIAGIILGLLFIMAAVMVLFHLAPPPADKMPVNAEHFMTALGTTPYLTFVKILELLGGILVAIPRFRNIGLLILGPIIVNILAFHTFLGERKNLHDPMMIVIVVLALYLLWVERKAWAGLVRRSEAEVR